MPRPYFHNKFLHIDEILRIDHAGEYGAIRIYEGQLALASSWQKRGHMCQPNESCLSLIPASAVMRPKYLDDSISVIKHMLSQEQNHLEYFEKKIAEHGARPTLLLPLWNILGFAMGYVSALSGVKVSMLCTEAVEEVIDEHYQVQHKLALAMGKKELAKNIEQHRQDELHHRDTAIEYGSSDVVFYPYIKMAIGKLCKFAIFASKII